MAGGWEARSSLEGHWGPGGRDIWGLFQIQQGRLRDQGWVWYFRAWHPL
jgi:hypothetical protein